MATDKKLTHFKRFSDFNAQKLSADEGNTTYTVGVEGEVTEGEPYILYQKVVFIKDVRKIWTHGALYDCSGTEAVMYVEQSLTEGQRQQACGNIGAIWASETNGKDYPSVTIN